MPARPFCVLAMLVAIVLANLSPSIAAGEPARDPDPAPPAPPAYAQMGPYVGAAAAFTVDQAGGDELEHQLDDRVNVTVDPSWAARLTVGERVWPHLAVEGQLEYVVGLDYSGSARRGGPGIRDFTVRMITGTANVKPYFTTGRAQPFVLVGLGFTYAEAEVKRGGQSLTHSDEGFAVRLAAGLDVYVTEELAIVGALGFVHPTGDTKDLDYFSFGLGLQYKFRRIPKNGRAR